MRQLAKRLTFYVGLIAALFGLLLALLPSTGNVHQGASGMYVTAAVLLLAASPALALPFSARMARILLFCALALLAAGALVAAFGRVIPTPASLTFKAAAVIFAILVAVRVSLSRRRKSTG